MDVKLLTIPVAITGGVGGTYLGYKYLHQDEPKTSIKSKLGDLLLGFDSSFSSKWQARATLVSAIKSGLSETLNKLRKPTGNNEISEADVKKGCQEQIEKEFTSDTDSLFVSVRNYCTFNNKDKLGEKVISEELTESNIKPDGKWKDANKKLSEAETTNMSAKMQEIRAKVTETSGADSKALKNGCEGIYTSYFKGNNDPDFKDAQLYCVEEVKPTPQ